MGKAARLKRKKAEQGERVKVEERSVSVLIPSGDLCHTHFAMSLVHMMQTTILAQPANLVGLAIETYGSTILPFSRQILAETALRQGATHTLWIDSDMRFPKEMLLHLLRTDAPIVGINATSRRPPYRNTAQSAPGVELETGIESRGHEKVYRAGFGVMWVATEVFRSMERPWFDFTFKPEMECWQGEDHYFTEKAKALGFEVVIDHDLSKRVEHLGVHGYNPVAKSLMGKIQGGVGR